MIQAKFTCTSVTKTKHWIPANGYLYSARFTAVTGGSEENKKFWEATPNGTLELNSILPDAFEPGKEYYINIELAE